MTTSASSPSMPYPSLSFRLLDAAGVETGGRCRALRRGEGTRPTTVLVRGARAEDLPDIAALHRTALPGGLFPQLGRGFLRRWHAAHLSSPLGVVLVAVVGEGAGERVVGFLTADLDHVAFVDGVLRTDRSHLLLAGAGALVIRPHVALRFLRTRARAYLRRLTTGSGRAPSPVAQAGLSPAELTAIAVTRDARGRGVGAHLLTAYHRHLGGAGVRVAELLTAAGSEESCRFYARHGWEQVRDETTRAGARLRRFRLRLDDVHDPVAP